MRYSSRSCGAREPHSRGARPSHGRHSPRNGTQARPRPGRGGARGARPAARRPRRAPGALQRDLFRHAHAGAACATGWGCACAARAATGARRSRPRASRRPACTGARSGNTPCPARCSTSRASPRRRSPRCPGPPPCTTRLVPDPRDRVPAHALGDLAAAGLADRGGARRGADRRARAANRPWRRSRSRSWRGRYRPPSTWPRPSPARSRCGPEPDSKLARGLRLASAARPSRCTPRTTPIADAPRRPRGRAAHRERPASPTRRPTKRACWRAPTSSSCTSCAWRFRRLRSALRLFRQALRAGRGRGVRRGPALGRRRARPLPGLGRLRDRDAAAARRGPGRCARPAARSCAAPARTSATRGARPARRSSRPATGSR